MSSKEIEVIKCTETNELYCKYDGQNQAQGCFVEIDPEECKIYASYNSEIGNAIPSKVWHDRLFRFPIPPLKNESVNELMEELKPLAQEIVDGYSCEWDGNNNVGSCTEQAQEAIDAIESICREKNGHSAEIIQIWDAWDWFQGEYPEELTSDTTNEEIETLAAQWRERNCNEFDVDVIDGVEEYLQQQRDALKDEELD